MILGRSFVGWKCEPGFMTEYNNLELTGTQDFIFSREEKESNKTY